MATRVFQPRLLPTAIMLLMLGVLVGLGYWQVERLAWKTKLLAAIDAHMAAPPVPMPELLGDRVDWQYRRVTLAGAYDYAHEFLIQPRTLDGKVGYHMVVPFRRASGGTVLVNRGWISDDLIKSAVRPQGLLQIEGVLQYPDKTAFTPDNAPATNSWFWIDTAAMGASLGLKDVPPAVVNIAESPANTFPVAGKLRLEFRNDHKQYAIFWFSMAGVLALIWFLSQWRVIEDAAGENKHARVQ
ncbi:MAG: SURF1 family protein [Micavibrio sp.]|nr:SURF1 family protein [Micavibrio sp.]